MPFSGVDHEAVSAATTASVRLDQRPPASLWGSWRGHQRQRHHEWIAARSPGGGPASFNRGRYDRNLAFAASKGSIGRRKDRFARRTGAAVGGQATFYASCVRLIGHENQSHRQAFLLALLRSCVAGHDEKRSGDPRPRSCGTTSRLPRQRWPKPAAYRVPCRSLRSRCRRAAPASSAVTELRQSRARRASVTVTGESVAHVRPGWPASSSSRSSPWPWP